MFVPEKIKQKLARSLCCDDAMRDYTIKSTFYQIFSQVLLKDIQKSSFQHNYAFNSTIKCPLTVVLLEESEDAYLNKIIQLKTKIKILIYQICNPGKTYL